MASFGDGNRAFVAHLFHQFRTSTGDTEMNLDASTADVDFFVTPSTVHASVGGGGDIHRVIFTVVDMLMAPQKFGGISALANGLEIACLTSTGGMVIDFLDGMPITTNDEFSRLAGSDGMIVGGVGNDDQMTVRWTISKSGEPFRLKQGEKLRIRLRDNLSDVDRFYAVAQGVYTSS